MPTMPTMPTLPTLRPLWLALSLCCAPALAHDPSDDWVAVDDSRLAAARGGLDAGNGLILSLGVERLVSINGNVVASSNFVISDLGKVAAGATLPAGEVAALTLVQNGAGNVFDAAQAAQGAAALVIQNSASDQLIRSQTTISAAVNSLSLLKGLNFEGGLRDALSNAVRPK
jgi:hypothetical protein